MLWLSHQTIIMVKIWVLGSDKSGFQPQPSSLHPQQLHGLCEPPQALQAQGPLSLLCQAFSSYKRFSLSSSVSWDVTISEKSLLTTSAEEWWESIAAPFPSTPFHLWDFISLHNPYYHWLILGFHVSLCCLAPSLKVRSFYEGRGSFILIANSPLPRTVPGCGS